jgi:predicted pyridoxine 5'-phosphate oxidase superfamily flavin-nucleotide-binding protein
MTKIPADVQEFVQGKMGWVATATPDGMPNTTPKGSVKIIDDEHIVFADLYSLKTRNNLLENPKIAVTIVDEVSMKGYQLKGVADIQESGQLFDKMAEDLEEVPVELPPLKYAIYITVESVYDQSVGLNAGKQIA